MRLSNDEVAKQQQRDFGFPHPVERIKYRSRFEFGPTGLHRFIGGKRIEELVRKGYSMSEAITIQLMRGADAALVPSARPAHHVEQVRKDPDRWDACIGEALKGRDLMGAA